MHYAAMVRELLRRAPRWPICGNSFEEIGRKYRAPVEEAARHRYYQFRPPGCLSILMFDDDRGQAVELAVRGKIPAPSGTIWNEATGHGHAFFLLSDPVGVGGRSRMAPLRLAEGVRDSLTVAMGADPNYTRFLARGPLAQGHTLEVLSGRTYDLRDLLASVPRISRAELNAERALNAGRNCGLFDHLCTVRPERQATPDEVLAALKQAAAEYQTMLETSHPRSRLPESEVRSTVRSVHRYKMAHKHMQPARRPVLPGALDRSQIHSRYRPPPAPKDEQQARQSAGGKLAADRKRERTRRDIQAAITVFRQQGQPYTLTSLMHVTGYSYRTIIRHRDLVDAEV